MHKNLIKTSTTIRTIKDAPWATTNHTEIINPGRRFISYVCKQLGINRKKFKKLMKNKEFRTEIEIQFNSLNQ